MYQDYAMTSAGLFYALLKQVKGRDLMPTEYLHNFGLFRVYSHLPGDARYALPYGDLELDWGVPQVSNLRLAARVSRDAHLQWLGNYVAQHRTPRSLGPDAVPKYVWEFFFWDPSLRAAPPLDLPRSRTFADLQGVIWRTGWGKEDLLFGLRTGPLGGRYLTDTSAKGGYPYDNGMDYLNIGHDHHDANSFFLYRGPVPLAREYVTYESRASEYHNTVLVDGEGQWPRLGQEMSYRPLPPEGLARAERGLEVVQEAGSLSYLEAEAGNAYQPDTSRVAAEGQSVLDQFRRRVLFVRPGYLVMVDTLRSASPHRYDWVCHFGRQLTQEGDWMKGVADEGQVLGVKLMSSAKLEAETGYDGRSPYRVPWLRVHPADKQANTEFITLLYPTQEAGWERRPQVSLLGAAAEACGIRVMRGQTEDSLFSYHPEQPVALAGYALHGRAAHVARATSGKLVKVALVGGTALSYRGIELLHSPQPDSTVEVTYRDGSLTITGERLAGLRIHAPARDARTVVVNGRPAQASRRGDWITLSDTVRQAPAGTR